MSSKINILGLSLQQLKETFNGEFAVNVSSLEPGVKNRKFLPNQVFHSIYKLGRSKFAEMTGNAYVSELDSSMDYLRHLLLAITY